MTQRIGESREVEIPDVFFDPEGELPESVVLEFTRPPIYLQLTTLELARHLAAAVERRVREARQGLAEAP